MARDAGRLQAALAGGGDLALSWTYGGTETPLFSIPARWLAVEAVTDVRVGRFLAWDTFRETGRRQWRTQVVSDSEQGSGRTRVRYRDDAGQALLTLSVEQVDEAHILLEMIGEAPGANRVRWGIRAGPQDLYGFGEYGVGPRIRTGRFATWAEEGPVGLGPASPYLRWTGKVPLPRGPFSTYTAAPLWLSSRGHGGWLENSERIEWTVHPTRMGTRVWSHHVRLHIVGASDLKGVLLKERGHLGRPPAVPAWIFAPWIDAVRGEVEVRRRAGLVRGGEVPASVVWVEDWMGSWEDARRFWMRPLSHRVDTGLYPDLPGLAADLHDAGFRLLGYFCPEVAEGTDLYREAESLGHLVATRDGTPAVVEILGHRHGEWDLTRTATRQFVHDRLLRPAVQMGFDGWMADFGEHLPASAALSDGTSGLASHNRYPGLWHETNRSFFDQERPDGDYTFFVRSSWLNSPALAPVFWAGDNDTDWDRADGLQAVVPQALSAGLIGHALFATEIAGYMTFGLTRPSSRELYGRWTELAALLPVMRTHHGTARPRNWRFDRDQETLGHFRRYARLHILLYPYLAGLADEASRTGLPLVRPLALEYPGHGLGGLNQQYLLGPDLLVAPVVRPGARNRRLFLPPGRWRHWWSSRTLPGPGWVTIEAPLGEIPLFIRAAAVLPLSEGTVERTGDGSWRPRGFVDTLVPGVDEGREAAEERVTLWTMEMPETPVSLVLPGERQLTVARTTEADPGGGTKVLPARHADHFPGLQQPGVGVNLPAGGRAVLSEGGLALVVALSGPGALEVIWRHA
ncbi:MAG: TIM-barrel domain-containing protein [Clostridia bacterium]